MKASIRPRILLLCAALMLLLALTAALAACGGRGSGGETTDASLSDTEPASDPGTQPSESTPADTQPEDDTSGGGTESQPVETQPETADPTVLIETRGYPAEQAGASSGVVLSVADFGAKGDGVTDDGPAVCAAVQAAAQQHATLTFEAGKTYLIATSTTTVGDQTGPLALLGVSGITIDGQGAVLKVTPGFCYFSLDGCADVRLTNLVFDYTAPVYLVGKVTGIRRNTVTFATDVEPNLESYDFSRVGAFCIKYNEGMQQRPITYISQMTRKDEKTVTVDFPNGVSVSKGDLVFLPNPGVGYAFNAPVSITNCTGAVVCENVTIRAASTMTAAINRNDAEIYFTNTDVMPDPDDGREIHMVGWRDGFHCSDNRLPIHWSGCETGVMFDDTFNIYGALGYVLESPDPTCVKVCHWGQYVAGQYEALDVRAGDVVDFYDNRNGEYYGYATVREAVLNPEGTTTVYFEYGQAIDGIPVGAQLANRATAAPGSTFTDCRFVGTYRFHRDLRFENCTFDILCMWIMVEDNLEGPLPGNIDFVNCTLSGPPQIDAMNRGANQYYKKIGKQITDIGFWGGSMEGTIRTRSQCTWTSADKWSEADLYTVKNARPTVVTAQVITPTETDLIHGAAYDWAYHTMSLSGAEPVVTSFVPEEALRLSMLNDEGFAGRVLRMSGEQFTPDGLSADSLPCLWHDGSRVTLTFTVISDKDGTVCVRTADGRSLADPVSFTAGTPTPVTITFISRASYTGLSLSFTGGGTVYVGTLRVTLTPDKDPPTDRLLDTFTFVWTDEVRVGEGQPLSVGALTDETVRAAVQGAASGFTTGTLLRLTGGGDFTGLTDPSFFVTDKRYHLSLDAYVSVPVEGAAVRLVARDSTGEGRVIAEGLFTQTGLCHMEADWRVGDTGETALALVVDGTPAQGMDVYLGDFSITSSISYKPSHYKDVWPFAYPSVDELREGFLFDYSDGHIMEHGLWGEAFTPIGAFDPRVTERLRAVGYGDTVYYLNTGVHLASVEQAFPGGHKITLILDVYDGIGNLAEPGDAPALVVRNMINGEDTTPDVHYTVTVDPNDSRHLTLTFVDDLTGPAPVCQTGDVILFCRSDVEMIIGSIWVKFD